MRYGQSKKISRRALATFLLALLAPLVPVWLIPGLDDSFRLFLSVAAPVCGGLLCVRLHPDWPQLPTPLAWFFIVMIAGMTAPFFLPEHWQPIPVILMFAVVITLLLRFLSRQMQAEDEALRTWHRLPATLRSASVRSQATQAANGDHRPARESWYLELDFAFEHQGTFHHASTASLRMPTPTYDTRAEAEVALVELQASPLVICVSPDDSAKVWPERWLRESNLRTELHAMKTRVFAVGGSALVAFFLVMVPLVMAAGTAASLLPADASVKTLSTLLLFASMLNGFVFTVATAAAALRRVENPAVRSRVPQRLGTILVLLTVTQLLLVSFSIRGTGTFDEEAAERYGVRAFAAWIAGSLPPH